MDFLPQACNILQTCPHRKDNVFRDVTWSKKAGTVINRLFVGVENEVSMMLVINGIINDSLLQAKRFCEYLNMQRLKNIAFIPSAGDVSKCSQCQNIYITFVGSGNSIYTLKNRKHD